MKNGRAVTRITPETNRALEHFEPLIRRAANFGVYWWLEMLAFIVAWQTVEAATGSAWTGFAFAFIGAWFMDSQAADRERVIECWWREAKW
ncbi:MAG TPA: hypothetical protein VIZ86_16480 [Pseudomonas sp.]